MGNIVFLVWFSERKRSGFTISAVVSLPNRRNTAKVGFFSIIF